MEKTTEDYLEDFKKSVSDADDDVLESIRTTIDMIKYFNDNPGASFESYAYQAFREILKSEYGEEEGINQWIAMRQSKKPNRHERRKSQAQKTSINRGEKIMNFIDAVNLMKQGKKMRRVSWDDSELCIGFDSAGVMSNWGYKGKYGQSFDWLGSFLGGESLIEAFLANDWEEYKELHTFEEAIKAFKDGKTIKRLNYGHRFHIRYVGLFDRKDIMADDWIIEEK